MRLLGSPSRGLLLVTVCAALIDGLAAADTINVPKDFETIQEAIEAANPHDEIIVAEGVYPEKINFLSKDIIVRGTLGAEGSTIDATGLFDSAVKCVSGEPGTSVLDGFIITGGTGEVGDGKQSRGGGMLIDGASTNVTRCTFIGNSADLGGGMFIRGGSPNIAGCTFRQNSATDDGGGLLARQLINVTVSACTFEDNNAVDQGGGMHTTAFGTAVVTGCRFDGNLACAGGGLYNRGTARIDACRFTANRATRCGGGGVAAAGPTSLISCLLSQNQAIKGGGLLALSNATNITSCTFSLNVSFQPGGGIRAEPGSTADVSNSILWLDVPSEIAGPVTADYSCIRGGFPGTGNIDLDPHFDSEFEGEFVLTTGSPCVDAADNMALPIAAETDLNGGLRFIDDPETADTGNGIAPITDMGALEFEPGEITFEGPNQFGARGVPNVHAVADFNGDLLDDVVAVLPADIFQPTGRIQIFLNNGNAADGGEWQGLNGDTPPANVGDDPSGVAEGLFDNDAIADLVISNFGDNTVSILLGNGDGTFRLLKDIEVGVGPSDVVAADLTDDGITDFAVANETSNDVWIFENLGNAVFRLLSMQGTGGAGPHRMNCTDIDNDKCIDIGGVNNATGDGPVGDVFILHNLGGGQFELAGNFPIGTAPSDLSVGLLNDDAFADIVAANSGDGTFSVLLNRAGPNGRTFEVLAPAIDTGPMPLSIDLADFDDDDDADVAVVSEDPDIGPAVRVLENFFDGQELSFGVPTGFDVEAIPNFIACGDFDADDKVDMVTVNLVPSITDASVDRGSLTVLLNATGLLALPLSFTFMGEYVSGSLTDLHRSDDSYLALEPTLGPMLAVRLEVEARALEEEPTQFIARVEAAVTAAQQMPTQEVSLLNHEMGAWILVDQREATAEDSKVEFLVEVNPCEFIDPNTRKMRMRIDWFDPENALPSTVQVRVDETVWLLAE